MLFGIQMVEIGARAFLGLLFWCAETDRRKRRFLDIEHSELRHSGFHLHHERHQH